MAFPMVYQADVRTIDALAQSLAEWLAARARRLPGAAATDFLCMGRAAHLMVRAVECNRSRLCCTVLLAGSHAAWMFLHGATETPTTELPSTPSTSNDSESGIILNIRSVRFPNAASYRLFGTLSSVQHRSNGG